jgi:ABC-type transporter Mla MlaB component
VRLKEETLMTSLVRSVGTGSTLSWPLCPGALPGSSSESRSHLIETIGVVDVIVVDRVGVNATAVAAQSSDLAADVSGVHLVDAGGLGLVAMLHRLAAASSGQMSFIGTAAWMRQLLRIVHLGHLLSGEPTCR